MNKKNELIEIVKKQDINKLKLFIKENINFNFTFTTEKGENLLHFSTNIISSNTLSIIQILLEKGLDPLSVNENFLNALDIAKENNNIPALTIMKHFINKKNKEDQFFL